MLSYLSLFILFPPLNFLSKTAVIATTTSRIHIFNIKIDILTK